MILFIVSFIAGVLTVLAPCILPLLPVVLAGSVSETKNKRRPLIIIASLSLSVFVFTLILKGSTALIGASPTFWNYVSALILAAFGLTLVFPIAWAKIVLKIPGHNNPDRWISKGYGGNSNFWTDVLVGAALGPVFTTCSPTFFVILATVLPQSLAMGIIDLLAYIIGLALALLAVAFVGQNIIDKLGWATNPNGWFRKALGIIFVILAVLIAFGLDKKIESTILNSGFLDVTTLEQSIHQSLGGPQNESKFIEIVNPAGFVNSAPFKLADFVGKKVILIDFIDYSCINCERTFPYLNSWWNKYKDQGLEIVGIHTPEFAFEKDPKNVEAAAQQFGLMFPIVLDNDYSTWNAYQNEYWPHKYLIDIRGNVVYDKIGEGDDDVIEAEIVKLLNDRMKFLGQNEAVNVGSSTLSDYIVQAQSPETYFGSSRNEFFGNGTPGIKTSSSFAVPNDLTPNQYYLGGSWNIQNEYSESASTSSQVSYIFTAAKMHLVAGTADGSTISAQILIDGKPIPKQWFGTDVDPSGKVNIDMSRLYNLYANKSAEQHRLDIIFSKPGVRIYTFTFS